MAGFVMIIDPGLPYVEPYYKKFPREPSPAGHMTINPKEIKKPSPFDLGKVLDEMVKVDAGGTVLLVCHGHRDQQSGDLIGINIPLGGGSTQRADREILPELGRVARVEAGMVKIRAMPQGNDAEQTAKMAKWNELFLGEKVIASQGFTLDFMEKAYQDWKDREQKALAMPFATAAALAKKMTAVQDRHLDRVEIRACELGKDPALMKIVKNFFGCKKLLAPDARMFYIESGFPINATDRPGRWTPENDVKGRPREHQLPRSVAGLAVPDRIARGKKRNFAANSGPGTPGLLFYIFFSLDIWEFEDKNQFGVAMGHRYGAAGITMVDPTSRSHDPFWARVKEFVDFYIMPASGYTRGAFPLAGMWSATAAMPWSLPDEQEYLKGVKKV